VVPQPPEQVWNALMAVNRPTAPFVVRDGRPEGVDLIAEWRIVDAQWKQVFMKSGLQKSFQILMRFHPDDRRVRSLDKASTVSWSAGGLLKSESTARGNLDIASVGMGLGFTEHGQCGETYHYRFSSNELKHPLKAAATGAGWVWRNGGLGNG
ncbi:MAG: hypothetical protein ACRDRN_03585, partial [Sciscionella sp.]